MGVTVKRTGSLPRRAWDADASRDAGAKLVQAIVTRTFDRGLDVDDKPFAAYRPGYVEDLRDAGESTRVDLTRTGALRRGVARSVGRVDRDRVTLTLPADLRGQVAGLSRRRRFWGVSPSDRSALREAIRALIVRTLARSRR